MCTNIFVLFRRRGGAWQVSRGLSVLDAKPEGMNRGFAVDVSLNLGTKVVASIGVAHATVTLLTMGESQIGTRSSA